VNKALSYGSGSALGLAANHFAINRIENPWLRNGARVVGAVAAGTFLGGKYNDMAGAAAGAVMYPMFQELAIRYMPGFGAAGTEADLDILGADLEAIDAAAYGDF
jgi:hypothetical protein